MFILRKPLSGSVTRGGWKNLRDLKSLCKESGRNRQGSGARKWAEKGNWGELEVIMYIPTIPKKDEPYSLETLEICTLWICEHVDIMHLYVEQFTLWKVGRVNTIQHEFFSHVTRSYLKCTWHVDWGGGARKSTALSPTFCFMNVTAHSL